MTLRCRAKVGRNGTFSIAKNQQKKLGLHPGEFVEVILDVPENKNRQPKRRYTSIMGKYAGLGTVDEFLAEKQKEIDLEEERFQRWNKGLQQKP